MAVSHQDPPTGGDVGRWAGGVSMAGLGRYSWGDAEVIGFLYDAY